MTDNEIRAMFGPSEVGIIEQNLNCKDFVPKAIEVYYEHYNNEHHKFVNSNASLNELLSRLKSQGLKLGIYTGKARRSYEISCNHLKMGRFFDLAITGDDVIRPKPDPEGLIKALSVLNLQPNEVLYVGDSDADIEAGIRAGIRTIGVNWFNTTVNSKFIVQPDYTVSDINELIKIIENI